jgi:hypothetical protein
MISQMASDSLRARSGYKIGDKWKQTDLLESDPNEWTGDYSHDMQHIAETNAPAFET